MNAVCFMLFCWMEMMMCFTSCSCATVRKNCGRSLSANFCGKYFPQKFAESTFRKTTFRETNFPQKKWARAFNGRRARSHTPFNFYAPASVTFFYFPRFARTLQGLPIGLTCAFLPRIRSVWRRLTSHPFGLYCWPFARSLHFFLISDLWRV